MKKKYLMFLAGFLCGAYAMAQSYSAVSQFISINVTDKPSINWQTLSEDNSTLDQGSISVQAQVTSRSLFKTVELVVNGEMSKRITSFDEIQEESGTLYKATFNEEINLLRGENIVEIVAVNVHNSRADNGLRTINRRRGAPAVVVEEKKDEEPPQIFLSNPANIQDDKVTSTTDMFRISGTVIDEAGVKSLRINGMQAPMRANGEFSTAIPLSPGDNQVTLEATDMNNNVITKKFTVVKN